MNEKKDPEIKSTKIAKQKVKPLSNDTLLFEISWEICNQLGGIYTVIRSKIPSIKEVRTDNNYFLIGPYIREQALPVFDPIREYSGPVGKAVLLMRDKGYEVKYGRWLVSGRPRVILFNPFVIFKQLAEIKYELWEHHSISTPGEDDMLNQVVAFGYQVKEFFSILCSSGFDCSKVLAHFHEWMAGIPIPEMRRLNLDIKIIFTTHATLLGRYLAMNDNNFYGNLYGYSWENESSKFNVNHIVSIERAAAHGAHIFTTVSNITAKECVQFLGREPEVILPNGLNIERFEVLHKVQNLHLEFKEKIHEFVMGHFFQSYSFDLDKTLYFYTSGRFEYHNKGYDLVIEALARLNWKMKEANIDKTVVAFIVTKQPFYSFNPEVLQLKAQMEEIRNNCREIQEQLGKKLYYKITSNNGEYTFPNLNELVDDYNKLKLRRHVQSWKNNRLPTIVTHNLVDDANDPVLNFMRTANLVNHIHDKVKVVYHPDFISPSNPLFRMDYQQFIRGCHLGLFPSYYEPWGYTPLESLASGIPAVTSDLSGFGDYVKSNIPKHEDSGIYVVERKNADFWTNAEELANIMFDFVKLNRRERIALRNKSEESSLHFDWRNLRNYYLDAYQKALDK